MYNDQEKKYPLPSRSTKEKVVNQRTTKRSPILLILVIAVVGLFIGAKAFIGGQDQEAVEQQVLPSETKAVESKPEVDSEPKVESKLEEKTEVEVVKWQPIGTVQTEPHITTFEKESMDWQEMTKALQYATNLSEEEMIIWRLGNGGAPDLAVGTVSTSVTKDTPTLVRLQWIENQGWMPTEVIVLDSNEYLTE